VPLVGIPRRRTSHSGNTSYTTSLTRSPDLNGAAGGTQPSRTPVQPEWSEEFGDELPSTMWDELEILTSRLA
jgi:hypothetical protein